MIIVKIDGADQQTLEKYRNLYQNIDKMAVIVTDERFTIEQIDVKPNDEVIITCAYCGYRVVPKGEIKQCPHCGGKC